MRKVYLLDGWKRGAFVGALGLTGFALLLYGCAPRLSQEQLEGKYGTHPPAIVKYGAVDRLRAGETWKVFVAAEDPDGDMDSVRFEIVQAGQGGYVPYSSGLEPDMAKSFSGYYYLNTPHHADFHQMFGVTLTLRCKVKDKAGHFSKTIELPLAFIGQTVSQSAPEGFGPEEVRALGPIPIQLKIERGGDNTRFGK